MMNFLAAGSPTADIAGVVNIVKGVMALFTEFPLNIMLAASIAGIGFKVFKKGKGAVKP